MKRALPAWSGARSSAGGTRPPLALERPPAGRAAIGVVGQPEAAVESFATQLVLACRRREQEVSALVTKSTRAARPLDAVARELRAAGASVVGIAAAGDDLRDALEVLPPQLPVVATGDRFAEGVRPLLLVELDDAVRRRPPRDGVDLALPRPSRVVADALAAWLAQRFQA